MDLPDINIWLALTFESHAYHKPARSWFESRNQVSCAFCRITQQGFLRLATNPSAFGREAVTLKEAWTIYDTIAKDDRVFLVNEPNGLEPIWRQLTNEETFSPKIWNDAYLSAFALAGAFKLITFDKGFRQFLPFNIDIDILS